ncbi:hypothetical protein BCR25_04035 [Enterococcus termitis]|uniref:Uncharacterized protein n=1 Tax=Enterococcus termitis TaxID=332950 RepID=A0A1E5GVP6_9ENTE|nr:hypothetical protein BCR25_04035 [Enterococcus termitis]
MSLIKYSKLKKLVQLTFFSNSGKVYEVTNLKNFVTQNLDLFEGSSVNQVTDGIVKIKASQLGKRKNPCYSYKGWTLISWRD